MNILQVEKKKSQITIQFLEQEICKCNFTFCPREKHQSDNWYRSEGNGEVSLWLSQDNMGTYDKYLNYFLISQYRMVSFLFFFNRMT